MASGIDQRTRLRRDGTSQVQRGLAALDPTGAPVDAREVEDFLAFASAFSRHVVHVGSDGVERDWTPFFGCDAAAVVAAIDKTDPRPLRDAFQAAIAGPPRPETLARVFASLLEPARRLEQWLRAVHEAPDFQEQVRKRIRANLPAVLCRLLQYNLAATQQFPSVPALDVNGFSRSWTLDSCQRRADETLFGGATESAARIEQAIAALTPLFAPVYNVLLEVIGIAAAHFDGALSGRRDHEPHFALFVAFLRLYMLLRDDANRLTRDHLDFFYRQVLGIERRPARADQLHVLVEIARQVDAEHRLAAGTELDGGEDSDGAPLRYTLDRDLVANRARVEQLKTVFVHRDAHGIKRIAAAPVADSADGEGAEIVDVEPPSWATLGGASMPAATLGFAVASRALLLAEGTRTIRLLLVADAPLAGLTAAKLRDVLHVRLSGAEGWIEPPPAKIDPIPDNGRADTLSIEIDLPSTAPAVTFADPEVLGQDFGTRMPLLAVTLRHPEQDGSPRTAYALLKGLKLKRIALEVGAAGITSLVVQNDAFAMDPGTPFVPFGTEPRKGSNFYVGCAEAFEKDLDKLVLHLTWDQLPQTSFKAHYLVYGVPPEQLATSGFTATAAVIQDGKPITVEADSNALFAAGADDVPKPERKLAYNDLKAQAPRTIGAPAPWTPATQHGFLRLTLGEQGFLHDKYIGVLTLQTMAMARLPDHCIPGARYIPLSESPAEAEASQTCTIDKETPEILPAPLPESLADPGAPLTSPISQETPEVLQAPLPNLPYTPTLKAFSLDYEASTAIDIIDGDGKTAPSDLKLIHIEPFGTREPPIPPTAPDLHLLPQLDDEGALLIGLADLAPRQGLDLLFQLAEASADADVPKPTVHWDYLAIDDWKPFEAQDVTDATRGLIASGVVSFRIPKDISPAERRLPAGLHWLRARVGGNAAGVSDAIGVHAQAVRATLADADTAPDHYQQPLAAGTVAGLARADADVAKVEQPYPSFGARPAEAGLAFYARVAEHLRHKGRAITVFDYEHLLLERFPSLYKVKCIGHADADGRLAPGQVLIAVIPDFRKLTAVDRMQPKVTLDDLDEIAAYLQSINCPFVHKAGDDGSRKVDGNGKGKGNDSVTRDPCDGARARLHVLNPRYEKLRVDCKVRFRPEVTAVEFQRRALAEAINRFLSPWAYDDGADIAFGGKVYKSSILNFVEEQPEVDFVTDFVLSREQGTEDLEAIEAETARSILVPVPALTHGITAIEGSYSCSMTQPIPPAGTLGELAIGDDFAIGDDQEGQA